MMMDHDDRKSPASAANNALVEESEELMTCQFIQENTAPASAPAIVVSKEAATTTTTKMENDDDNKNTPQEQAMVDSNNHDLQVGDHVYQWRRLLGIPWVFQHHGIVMDVIQDNEGKAIKLTIADFSNVETNKKQKPKQTNKTNKIKKKNNNEMEDSDTSLSSSAARSSEINDTQDLKDNNEESSSQRNSSALNQATSNSARTRRLSLAQEGVIRAYTDTDKWHRVHYEAAWWKRQVYRSGTATKAKSDPVGMVLARVNFILQHPELLPDYHVVNANCECVAFWCKTGSWSTLQASSFLELTAAGQVKSSATLAAAAAGATSTVTVPAAGMWGWLGYTSTAQVSWLSLHPMAIPGLACYAAVTIGAPAMVYASAHKQWKETSKRLCDAFWEWATESPEVFAELITHWSDKGS